MGAFLDRRGIGRSKTSLAGSIDASFLEAEKQPNLPMIWFSMTFTERNTV